jgi:signal transduction histidine kinase
VSDALRLFGDGEGGFGLVSMRERVKLLGGQIAIESSPGAGVRLAVRIPLELAGERAASVTGDAMPARGGRDQ